MMDRWPGSLLSTRAAAVCCCRCTLLPKLFGGLQLALSSLCHFRWQVTLVVPAAVGAPPAATASPAAFDPVARTRRSLSAACRSHLEPIRMLMPARHGAQLLTGASSAPGCNNTRRRRLHELAGPACARWAWHAGNRVIMALMPYVAPHYSRRRCRRRCATCSARAARGSAPPAGA